MTKQQHLFVILHRDFNFGSESNLIMGMGENMSLLNATANLRVD